MEGEFPVADSLISAYGSILQALLTIAALVNLFISISIQRKIDRCIDVLEDLQGTNWNNMSDEESRGVFDSMIELYTRRYESAKLSVKAKLAILTLYGMCSSVSIMILVRIGVHLIEQALPLESFSWYFLVGSLSVAVMIVLGGFLYDLLSPEGGWIFKLDKPVDVCSAGYLSENLAIHPRVIAEKLGIVRISGVKHKDRYYIEFCNKLLETPMNYKITLKAKRKMLEVEEGSLKRGVSSNFEIKRKDFPPMFQPKTQWQIWMELRGPFPSSFAMNKSKRPNFKALQYVFEEKPIVFPFGVHVIFDLKAVAYRVPEQQYENFVIKEDWAWASDEWSHLTIGKPSCCID